MATAFALTTLVALSAPVNAANNEGGKCAKAGVSVTVVGKKLICTKSGKTLKWVVAFINPVALTDIKWSDNIRPTKDFSRPIWVKILGTTRDDEVAALSISSSGRIAVAGTTDGNIDGRDPNRMWDAFVAVYDGRGRQLWIRKFGTPQDDFARSVAIDSTGGVWVAGETLGGMEGNINAGERDAFLAKFSTDGSQEWITHISTERSERARGVVVDSRGNAIVVGTNNGSFPGFKNLASGIRDVFVAKFGSDGDRLWLQQFGSELSDAAAKVAINQHGEAIMIGYADSVDTGSTRIRRDTFVAKYSAQGTPSWYTRFGSGDDVGNSIALSANGSVYAVGTVGGSLAGDSSNGGYDAFIARIRPNGRLVWQRQFGTVGDDDARIVLVTENNLVVTGGSTTKIMDSFLKTTESNATLAVFCPDGTLRSIRQLGSSSRAEVNGLGLLPSGGLVVAGTVGPDGILGSVGTGETDGFIAIFPSLKSKIFGRC